MSGFCCAEGCTAQVGRDQEICAPCAKKLSGQLGDHVQSGLRRQGFALVEVAKVPWPSQDEADLHREYVMACRLLAGAYERVRDLDGLKPQRTKKAARRELDKSFEAYLAAKRAYDATQGATPKVAPRRPKPAPTPRPLSEVLVDRGDGVYRPVGKQGLKP